MINTILVVCIGNICRSPIGEGLFRRAFPEKTVHSAGLSALVGHPAEPFSVQIMAEQGIDIAGHRARQLEAGMVSGADIILTMDLAQKRIIEQEFATARGKVFRLGEFGDYDIPDPYRMEMPAFRHAYQLIERGVDVMIERIRLLG